ncbi:hypothetical protein MKS88_003078 [Plasmodium brasilianum]|uniref:Uncharacterized protein n=1 Tax=Plasmodium brasilianum TaxID=5824 RepID=A0ACB9Y8C0_PLABR|nr:hypothetical protein MKS88_003078 [Plasmodium brasilianum]
MESCLKLICLYITLNLLYEVLLKKKELKYETHLNLLRPYCFKHYYDGKNRTNLRLKYFDCEHNEKAKNKILLCWSKIKKSDSEEDEENGIIDFDKKNTPLKKKI